MAGADERARRELFFRQRAARLQKRIDMEKAMAGNPVARLAVEEGFRPLVQASEEARRPEEDEFPESKIVKNQNLW